MLIYEQSFIFFTVQYTGTLQLVVYLYKLYMLDGMMSRFPHLYGRH